MFETGFLDTLEGGTYQALSEIHDDLFEDIYEFDGKIRHVNRAKGIFRFALVIYLEVALQNIEKMPQATFDEIIEKYVEMNIVILLGKEMERSPIKDLETKVLLKASLTDKINDREIYMKGIDASYHYEGYYVYKTENLQDES